MPNDTDSPNMLTNIDGFGIGWYSTVPVKYNSGRWAGQDDGEELDALPTVYKCDRPPLHDANLISLCQTLESRCVFAHLRAVSLSAER